MDKDMPIPVVILTGFLGSGKTTLVKRILEEPHGLRVLVIQNEFSSEMGIEKPLLKDATGTLLDNILELPNGCICCSVKDALIGCLETFLEATPGLFDVVLVETSGVADPAKVIESFWVDSELQSKVFLSGVVCVVDASNFQRYLHSDNASVLSLEGTVKNESAVSTKFFNPRLRQTAVSQITCASVIIINKTDLIDEAQRIENLVTELKYMNPTAKIMRTTKCNIAIDTLMNLEDFTVSSTTVTELQSAHDTHEQEGISSILVSYEVDLFESTEVNSNTREGALSGRTDQSIPSVDEMTRKIGTAIWDRIFGDISVQGIVCL